MIKSLLRLQRQDVEALQEFYTEFVELHGQRPTALEAYHEHYLPRSARKRCGSWLGFVKAREGLSEDQVRALEGNREFLESLETTQLTRSYKMLVLQAMLRLDALPGSVNVDDLGAEVSRLARGQPRLRAEFGQALLDPKAMRRLLVENPIEAWTGGKGTGGESYFEYREGQFSCQLRGGPALAELVGEVTEWRLAEYLDRPLVYSGLLCKVSQAQGRPILFLPDRSKHPELPTGWTPVLADGDSYEANFVKVAVNVMRREGVSGNALHQLMRDWFGPRAGAPGTDFKVRLTQERGVWVMAPQGLEA